MNSRAEKTDGRGSKKPGGEERLVTYSFCGLLSFLLVHYWATGRFELAVSEVARLLPQSLLVGMFVYALYRRLIGELIFYPLQYELHGWYCWIANGLVGHRELRVCAIAYFREKLELKLSVFLLDDAYGIARECIMEHNPPSFWAGARVELHILYLSSVFSIAFSCVAWMRHEVPTAVILCLTGLGLYLLGLMADSMQQRREIYSFREFETEIIARIKRKMLNRP